MQIYLNRFYSDILKGQQTERIYYFIPPRTGAYEFICKGNEKLSGVIYSELTQECVNSAYCANQSVLRLATTLLYRRRYLIRIYCALPKNKIINYGFILNDFKEPSNAYFKYQWGLLNKTTGFDINILPLWKYIRKSSVKIGIADTGINLGHCSLKGHINTELSFDFTASKNAAEYGHGTYIAGIIGAQAAYEKGMIGISENPNIISLNILAANDNATLKASEAFISAINYSMKNNVKIISCSFCGKEFSKKEKETIKNAKDILFVLAAGNDAVSLDKKGIYPACYELENCIVVAAMDREGNLYPTSNYGGVVDIAAPGENIVGPYGEDKYTKASGTSSAVPFVSGVCSLLLETNPHLTPCDLKRIITDKNNVTQIKALNGKVKTGGIINAYKAFMSLKNVYKEI